MKSRIIFSLLSPSKIQSLPNGSLNLSSKSKIHTPNATFTHTFSTASGSKNLIKTGDSEKGSFRNAMEMMVEVILRNRRIPFGYNSYLNEVNKVPSLLSKKTSTSTSTFIKSQKIKYDYQSADLIAQDISFQLRNKTRSFRSIFTQIVRNIPAEMKKGVEGIRVSCSGRLKGAEIARTECAKYGKTSVNTINQKIDYATAEVSTRYGVSGVKVWISYRGGRGLSGVNGGSSRGFSTFSARGRSDNGDSYLTETRVDQYSVSPLLMKALQDAGYEKMTVVQEATLPVILKGQDILAIARTGTGKTGCSLTV